MSIASGLELTLLKLLKYREKFSRFYRHVPAKVLDARTNVVLSDFKMYFEQHPDQDKIDAESFFLWFRLSHPKLTEEAASVFAMQFKAMMDDASPEVERGIMERLLAAEAAYSVAELLSKWNDGDEVDLYLALRATVESYEQAANRSIKLPWVTDSIHDLLTADQNDTGLHWRLDCINRSLRPLRGGDFIVVAGRPDKGKTTFCTSELTFMAQQLADLYPLNRRKIYWLNNEGPGKRIKTRLYQSALNCTVNELVAKMQAGTIEAEYAAAVGGDPNVIQILDIHDYWSHEVEDIIKEGEPAVILFDMVDNIKFGGAANNNGQRTDQLLEAMYQWSRVIGVKHDAVVLATSQISADGDGLPYPTLPMLKDSKTGKQGAAEAIITLGASNDPCLASSRFIGSTKNKLHREGGPKDPRAEVVFDGLRGRYNMPE